MEVEIDLRGASPRARLVDPDDFKGFKVVLIDDGTAMGDRLAPVGVARVDEHAWVRIEELERLAGPSATAEWRESLAGMLDFARSKGWVDEELGAVRGHIERRR